MPLHTALIVYLVALFNVQPRGPPSAKEIEKIARRTTDIIHDHITTDVCVFGSAAAYLWADIGRVPNDIDILAHYPFSDAERMKEIIVDADDRYFLKPSRFREKTHKILMCRLPGWHAYSRCVKADVLTSGTIFTSGTVGLPEILASDTLQIDDIPVMPLFDLLVTKTQGWWDHRVSPREDYQAKVEADVVDVDALLDRAEDEGVEYDDERELFRHPEEFMEWALELARRFVRRHGRRGKWRAVGFPL